MQYQERYARDQQQYQSQWNTSTRVITSGIDHRFAAPNAMPQEHASNSGTVGTGIASNPAITDAFTAFHQRRQQQVQPGFSPVVTSASEYSLPTPSSPPRLPMDREKESQSKRVPSSNTLARDASGISKDSHPNHATGRGQGVSSRGGGRGIINIPSSEAFDRHSAQGKGRGQARPGGKERGRDGGHGSSHGRGNSHGRGEKPGHGHHHHDRGRGGGGRNQGSKYDAEFDRGFPGEREGRGEVEKQRDAPGPGRQLFEAPIGYKQPPSGSRNNPSTARNMTETSTRSALAPKIPPSVVEEESPPTEKLPELPELLELRSKNPEGMTIVPKAAGIINTGVEIKPSGARGKKSEKKARRRKDQDAQSRTQDPSQEGSGTVSGRQERHRDGQVGETLGRQGQDQEKEAHEKHAKQERADQKVVKKLPDGQLNDEVLADSAQSEAFPAYMMPPPPPHGHFGNSHPPHGRHPPPPHHMHHFPPLHGGPPPPPPFGHFFHGHGHGHGHGPPPPPPHTFSRELFPPLGTSPPLKHRPLMASSQYPTNAPQKLDVATEERAVDPSAKKGSLRIAVHDRQRSDGPRSPVPLSPAGMSHASSGRRQLYDPSRDDSSRRSAQRGPYPRSLAKSAAPSLGPSLDTQSISGTSVTSIDYKNARHSGKELLDDMESTSTTAGAGNTIIRELKAAYKEILSLETELQEEDAMAQEEIAESDETEQEEQFGSTLEVRELKDDHYWTHLALTHRRHAEACHSFMLRCLDPAIPLSLHSLPQKYNIPNRLWQIGFQLLLERFRSALPIPLGDLFLKSASDLHSLLRSDSHVQDHKDVLDILEHMTDFIYYSYTFYAHALEEQSLNPFRSAWMEQLGDLARYRMTVAALAAAIAVDTKSMDSSTAGPHLPSTSDTKTNSATSGNEQSKKARKGRRGGFGDRRIFEDDELEDMQNPGDSIGNTALSDWELSERETWRTVAQEWYHKGLMETPGTGRLHHNLALLSLRSPDFVKDKACRLVDLRCMYHISKGLTASHPYASGREEFLSLFDQDLQHYRTLPRASAISLFLHLEGLLFNRVSLDTFPSLKVRFFESLNDTYVRATTTSSSRKRATVGKKVQAKKASREGSRSARHKDSGKSQRAESSSEDDVNQGLAQDATWIMIAISCIASVLQFGSDTSVLRQLLLAAKTSKSSRNPSDTTSLTEKLQDMGISAASDASTAGTDGAAEQDKAGQIPGEVAEALQLMFDLLVHTCQHLWKPAEDDPAINPYVTVILTFLATIVQIPNVLSLIERHVPWYELVKLYNSIPAPTHVHSPDSPTPALPITPSSANKLFGTPLPEDWCIRGMEWTGKQLFGRGYFKSKFVPKNTRLLMDNEDEGPKSNLNLVPRSEFDVLDERFEGSSMPLHAGGPLNQAPTDQATDDGHESSTSAIRETIGQLRWLRISLSASWLCRVVPGLNLVEKTGKVEIGPELKAKIGEWTPSIASQSPVLSDDDLGAPSSRPPNEARHTHQAMLSSEGRGKAGSASSPFVNVNEEESHGLSTSSELPGTYISQPDVRGTETGTLNIGSSLRIKKKEGFGSTRDRGPTPEMMAIPGYTTFIFDTNALLSALDQFVLLLESKVWNLVIPLAVITELDGLQSNVGQSATLSSLSQSAKQALAYLEDNIKSYSKYLKVQTSRGNYLRDLSIKFEELDSHAVDGFHPDDDHLPMGKKVGVVRSLDDVIVNSGVYQKETWLDRRNILLAAQTPPQYRQNDLSNACKVILVSNDKNLRLKAKSKGVQVFNLRDLENLVEILGMDARDDDLEESMTDKSLSCRQQEQECAERVPNG